MEPCARWDHSFGNRSAYPCTWDVPIGTGWSHSWQKAFLLEQPLLSMIEEGKEAAVSQRILSPVRRPLPERRAQKNVKASLIWNEKTASPSANLDLGNAQRESVWEFC